jgi:putative protease
MTDKISQKKPELLAPAGDMEKLRAACGYGADAVYLGGEKYSLRAKAKNFGDDGLRRAVEYAHKEGVRVYAAVNIFAHNADFDELAEYFIYLRKIGADAVIISDPGIFALAREVVPDMDIHISTQANVTNYKSVLFWKGLGASRVVLARELSFDEIREIRSFTRGEVQLEAFVHGAMCVSYSGRCLLSSFLSGRPSNKGECSHPCRWKYRLFEQTREGEFFPIEEDKRGSYILNSKDLCMIEHIPEVFLCGLDSLKIEGRAKTVHYTAAVTKAYREAIDDYFESPGKYFSRKEYYIEELRKVSSRGFTTGFYFRTPAGDSHAYNGENKDNAYDFVGVILGYNEALCLAEVQQRNRFATGDTVEFLSADKDCFTQEITQMYDEHLNLITEAPHPQQTVFVKTDCPVKSSDIMRKKASSAALTL